MELKFFNTEANKIWKQISITAPTEADALKMQLDLYKKFLVYFQIGESCYFIFNFLSLDFDFASPETGQVTGYLPTELTPSFFMERIHPEDRGWFLGCQDTAGQFVTALPAEKQMKYKLRFDFRFAHKKGHYIRVMQQAIVAQNTDDGKVIRTLIIISDITHLKESGRGVMSYIGMDGEPSYHDVDVKDISPQKTRLLSNREIQVLSLLAIGKSSKEIADILYVSKYTIDTHRKNMLRKSKSVSTGELVNKAIRDGWI